MHVSRLRIRLAGGFALAFAVGLAVLAALGVAYLTRVTSASLTSRLARINHEVFTGVTREYDESPDSSLAFVAHQVIEEWSGSSETFMIIDSIDAVVASIDPLHLTPRALKVLERPPQTLMVSLENETPHFRMRIFDTTYTPRGASRPTDIRIVSFATTTDMERDANTLTVMFAVSLPIVFLISLFAGYLLAGRALRPMRKLGEAIAAIAPSDLDTRLPVTGGDSDEVSVVATEFNALLGRLQEAQARNIQFVREAAHQIRTPLTLVLGEASHALGEGRSAIISDAGESQATLTRIRSAAQAMRRRVDELFLLAESRNGEIVRLEDQVELDELVLECTELMRPRARETGHRLAIGAAEAIMLRGNASLLQEAIMELIENACRYGSTSEPITVSCATTGVATERYAILDVASHGDAFTLPVARSDGSLNGGMGLSIVRWVASSHHGTLQVERRESINHVQLILPIL